MSVPEPNGTGPPDSIGEPQRPPPASSALLAIRLVALVGVCAVVGWQLITLAGLGPRQSYGVGLLVVAAMGVVLTLFVLLRRAAGRLSRHPDLLIPLGMSLTAEAILTALASLPALAGLFAPNWPIKIASISVTVSFLLVTQIVLGVVYAGWTTALVLQTVRGEPVDPVGAITAVRRWFPRVLVVVFVGWVVLFAGLAAVIPVAATSIGLALALIGAGALVWNLATAALLPVVVAEGGTLGSAMRAGFRVSWVGKRRWWVPVIAQMILLGWITYIHVSFTENPRQGVVRQQTRTSWHVHAFWTGGYENTCHWHTDVMKAVEAPPLPLVTTLLGLLFGVLAVVVKLRIADEIYGPRSGGDADPPAERGDPESAP